MTGLATYRTLVFLKEHWGSFDGWVGLLGIGWGHWMSILIRHICCFAVQKRRLLMHMDVYLVQLS